MKLIINSAKLFFMTMLMLAMLLACNQTKENKQSEGEHQEVKFTKDYVGLTQQQIEGVKIQFGKIDMQNLSNLIKASGMLDLPPQKKASVSSLQGGRVIKINVIQGDYVKQGDVIAVLENPEILKLQQDYLEAKSRYNYTEKEYQRQKELYEEKIVAGKKFQATEADYYAQQALLSSIESQLLQMGISPKAVSRGAMSRSIPIKSPIDGFVNKIETYMGAYIDPAKEMFMVVDNSHIHIDLQIYERDVPKVEVGQTVYFNLPNFPEQQYEAEIFAIGKAFEHKNNSVSIHADIKGNKNKSLLPGMYVDGRIQVDDVKVKALPDEAIISQGDLKYIFVKTDSVNTDKEILFKRVPVHTGISDRGYTEVTLLDSISPNASIAIKGTYYLQSKMKQAEEAEGEE